jgi:hypothetical protein
MAKNRRVKWNTECQFGAAFEAACRQAVILAAIEQALKGV